MKNFISVERVFIEKTFMRLYEKSENEVSAKRENSWSKKEIIGHLIDSASNNHQRFVRAQFKDDLVFPGYDQDQWVAAQNYQSADWHSLIQLWKEFNLLIIHVVENISEDILKKERVNHNLYETAWKEIPAGKPATLEYFIKDYFDHLRHHIDKIFVQE